MKDGLVDIILPTYRRPHTIGYAIQSVRQQTYPAWRLNVVGDGCDDQTEAVARSFDDPRIVFYRFPKARGYGYVHRNAVLRQTDGEFVAYVSDDDLWFSDHLAHAVDKLNGERLALASFRAAQVKFPDHLDPYFFAFDWQARAVAPLLRRLFVGSTESVHRRTVFEHVGYWNDALFRFGDREFQARVRASPLPTKYFDKLSVLRFYALQWDSHYAGRSEPPQAAYVEGVRDPAWTEQLRLMARRRERSWSVRRRQWHDFMRFGLHSGPKLLRFWYEKSRQATPRASTSAGRGQVAP